MKASRILLTLAFVAQPSLATGQSFSPNTTQIFNSNELPDTLAIGDIDQDGILDIAYAGTVSFSATIRWFRGLGGGSFAAPSTLDQFSVFSPRDMQVHDVTGDSVPDIIMAASNPKAVMLIEGIPGGGALTIQQVGSFSFGPYSVDHGNLDNDNNPDIVAAGSGIPAIAWLERDTGGNWTQTSIENSGAFLLVRTGDMTGNGSSDVAAVGPSGITIYLNGGSGTFAAPAVLTNSDAANRALDLADYDQDQDIDICSAGEDGVFLWLNDGNGVFTLGSTIAPGTGTCTGVHSADIDADGDIDALVSSQEATFWIENKGTSQPLGTVHLVREFYGEVAHGDLSGDGLPDIARLWLPDLGWHLNQTAVDCDGNGTPEYIEVAEGSAIDCNSNLVADKCEILLSPSTDQNLNGILDVCDSPTGFWARSPLSGRYYTSWQPSTWLDSEASAVELGGHLACFQDPAEHAWATQLFSAPSFWIGYSDHVTEGSFNWIDGSSVSFENWAPGAPSSFTPDQDFVFVSAASALWETHFALTSLPGLISVGGIDCDNNGIPDTVESSLNPTLDFNGDSIKDDCISPNYCSSTQNSSGGFGAISALGSPVIQDNNLTLTAQGCPPGQWSYFLMSQTQGHIPLPGGQGSLCLSLPIIRFNTPMTSQIQQISPQGTRDLVVDLGSVPQIGSFTPGQTWHFQLWFRDVNPQLTSNTTDAISILFR